VVSSVQDAQPTKLIQIPAPAVEPYILAKSSPAPRPLWQRRYGTWLRVADFLVISAAVMLAQLLRFGATPATLDGLGYSVVSVLIIGSWVWFLMIYRARARAPGVAGGYLAMAANYRAQVSALCNFSTTARRQCRSCGKRPIHVVIANDRPEARKNKEGLCGDVRC
jgi:hypothetical protein